MLCFSSEEFLQCSICLLFRIGLSHVMGVCLSYFNWWWSYSQTVSDSMQHFGKRCRNLHVRLNQRTEPLADKKHRKCQGESHIGKRRLAMLTPVNWPPQGLSKNSFVGKLPLEPIQQLHDVACSFRWTSNCKGIAKLHRNHEALKRLFLLGRMLPRF